MANPTLQAINIQLDEGIKLGYINIQLDEGIKLGYVNIQTELLAGDGTGGWVINSATQLKSLTVLQ